MEHYDGEFYTLRLFSPIEGEIYSLNSTEEGIHLTAYEMKNYSSFIRDHMEGVGLLGKRNQKLMTYSSPYGILIPRCSNPSPHPSLS